METPEACGFFFDFAQKNQTLDLQISFSHPMEMEGGRP
jgi:hypothetical protein